MRTSLSIACWLALSLAGPSIADQALLAQTPATNPADSQGAHNQRPEKSGKAWHLSGTVRLQADYDDNIFLLSPSRKADIASPSAAERTSGQWNNMESAWDIIAAASAAVGGKGPGLAGRSLEILPEVSYDLYTQNPERSNVRLGVSLKQELWSDSRVRLQAEFTPNYFAKNYLFDAVDQDGNLSISSDERVYRAGDYRDVQLGLDYRIPFARSTRKHPFGVALQVGGGYYDRAFDDPFPGRDLNGPSVGAELLFDLGRKVSMDLAYDFAPLGATTTREVVLLDEPEFGQDFNGNGTSSEDNVRVVAGVDRSRRERNLAASLRVEVGKSSDVTVGYQRRWREFTSDEPLDVSNKGRDDDRNRWSADLRIKVAKDLRLRLGGAYTSQTTNRANDPGSTGEVADYTSYQGSLGLSYEL